MKSTCFAVKVFVPALSDDLIAWAAAQPNKIAQQYFCRADRHTLQAFTIYHYLFDTVYPNTAKTAKHSIASLRYWGDTGQAPDDWVLCADPVYLQPDRDQLLLSHADFSDLSRMDTAALMQEINAVIQFDGWQLVMGAAERWYLQYSEALEINTPLFMPQQGSTISHGFAEGAQRRKLLSVINTVQMIMHGSAVNQRRQAKGLLPINSLLPWGSGVLARASVSEFQESDPRLVVWGNDAIVRGMMLAAGVQMNPLDQWSVNGDIRQDCLLLLPKADQSSLQYYLLSLFHSLHTDAINNLRFITADGSSWYATKKHLRRWWKGALR